MRPQGGGMIPGMIPGMGPAPPNMSAANMVQNHTTLSQKMLADNGQIVVSQAGHPMLSSPVPNQTISNFPPVHMPVTSMSGPGMSGQGMSGQGMSGPGMSGPGMPGQGMSGPGMRGVPTGPNLIAPDNKKPQLMSKMQVPGGPMSGGIPPPMSPVGKMVSPPGGGRVSQQQRTPPTCTSPGDARDNITLNTAVAEPLPGDDPT